MTCAKHADLWFLLLFGACCYFWDASVWTMDNAAIRLHCLHTEVARCFSLVNVAICHHCIACMVGQQSPSPTWSPRSVHWCMDVPGIGQIACATVGVYSIILLLLSQRCGSLYTVSCHSSPNRGVLGRWWRTTVKHTPWQHTGRWSLTRLPPVCYLKLSPGQSREFSHCWWPRNVQWRVFRPRGVGVVVNEGLNSIELLLFVHQD